MSKIENRSNLAVNWQSMLGSSGQQMENVILQ